MHNTNNMNKEKFAAFVCVLRKEKGMTQKELAAALFVSDKAVSKWETRQSLPDVSLLIPLAEQLGVTVTELLQGRRNETATPIPPQQVEDIVKTAVNISRKPKKNNKLIFIYVACLIIGARTQYEMMWHVYSGSNIMLMSLMLVISAAAFGLYFLFIAPERLPDYYDTNRINYYVHGPVRMNVPGVCFNNTNWKNILACLRLWCLATMATCPTATIITGYLVDCIFVAVRPAWPHPMYLVSTWETAVLITVLMVYMGSLFAAAYIPGRKHKKEN